MTMRGSNWRPGYQVVLVDECSTCEGTGVFTNINPMNESVRRTRCPDCGGQGIKNEKRIPLLKAIEANKAAIRAILAKKKGEDK